MFDECRITRNYPLALNIRLSTQVSTGWPRRIRLGTQGIAKIPQIPCAIELGLVGYLRQNWWRPPRSCRGLPSSAGVAAGRVVAASPAAGGERRISSLLFFFSGGGWWRVVRRRHEDTWIGEQVGYWVDSWASCGPDGLAILQFGPWNYIANNNSFSVKIWTTLHS